MTKCQFEQMIPQPTYSAYLQVFENKAWKIFEISDTPFQTEM